MRRRARHGPSALALCAGTLLALSCLTCAWSGVQRVRLESLRPDEARPLCWRVESTRGASLVLLGAVHFGPPEGWVYPPSIEEAFESASALVVEIDPDELDDPTQQMLLARYGMLPPGVRLQDQISAETWAELQHHLTTSDLPTGLIDHMRPWLVSNLLVLEATRRLGWSTRGGVDVGFIRRAAERSILPLETAEYQMSLFASLPADVQEMALQDTLGRFDEVDEYVTGLVDAWRVGDERALESFVFETYRSDPRFEPFFEAIFFHRNREMAMRLRVLLDAEQHDGETVFVTVGAGHLIGDRGIPALLRESGYRVVEMDSSARTDAGRPERRRLAVHP